MVESLLEFIIIMAIHNAYLLRLLVLSMLRILHHQPWSPTRSDYETSEIMKPHYVALWKEKRIYSRNYIFGPTFCTIRPLSLLHRRGPLIIATWFLEHTQIKGAHQEPPVAYTCWSMWTNWKKSQIRTYLIIIIFLLSVSLFKRPNKGCNQRFALYTRVLIVDVTRESVNSAAVPNPWEYLAPH